MNKIDEAILNFKVKGLDFYTFFLLNFNIEEASIPTACAYMGHDLRIGIKYNKKWVDSMSTPEIMFLLVHELMHILDNHLKRGMGLDQKIANIAMDMIINETIIREHSSEGLVMPKNEKGEESGVRMDSHYKGDWILEPLYEWLKEQNQKMESGDTPQLDEDTKKLLQSETGESLDQHGELTSLDEVSQEIKDQIVGELVERAKNMGVVDHKMESIIDIFIKKRRKDNFRELKRIISWVKSGAVKDPSHRRINRKGIFGLKGRVKLGTEINFILDVSGSMDDTEVNLALCEMFKDGYTFNLLQIDTEVQGIEKITEKSKLKHFKRKASGGTVLNPGIDFICDHKNGISKYPTVIFTDGYTDELKISKFRQKCIVMTTGTIPPLDSKNNLVKVLKIDKGGL